MQLILSFSLLFAAVLYTFALRGEPFRALGTLMQKSPSAAGALSPFAALSSALCGTLGVGSISAVTSALRQGGAGMLVWLWLGAIAGCSLKYAEIRITMAHKRGDLSGAMVALHAKCPALGYAYALLCLPVALIGMGNLTQVQVLSDALHTTAGLPRPLLALLIPLLLTLLLHGGIGRIGRAASAVLPAVAAVYIALCLRAVWQGRGLLPGIASELYAELMHPHAGLFALGMARGLFISEAGMGTAAFAHSQSGAPPRRQAAYGVCEVLFSTALATLTALAVLTSGVPLGAQAARSAFLAILGPAGDALLCVMLSFFAMSTLPVWWFYGSQCVRFLSEKAVFQRLYTAAFLLLACLGCLFPIPGAWRAADTANLLLTVPALVMLLLYLPHMRSILPNRAKRVILKSSRRSSFLR